MEEKIITNPVKVIRAKCLDCCCGQVEEVKQCGAVNCPLYKWRFGKNPYRTPKQYTNEQRQAISERMKKLRAEQLSKTI